MKKEKNINTGKKVRALLLFSGGLDSMLTACLLKRLSIEVFGVSFVTPFFGITQAEKSAKKIGLKLIKEDITKDFFHILLNPKHGYGKNINPCIDCHTFMVKKAFGILSKYNASFIATGEVLGERPFSQNKESLNIVAKESGADKLLLRPLSGKLLAPTIPEIKGWIRREDLLAIYGRSRKKQIELAKKFGIKSYPTPASGCCLTDPGYSQRLRELLKATSDINKNNVELIKYGRPFWQNKILILVGRHKNDNKMIKKLSKSNDILMEAKDFAGPLTFIRNYSKIKMNDSIIKKAAKMTAWYGKGREEKEIWVSCKLQNQSKEIKVKPKLR
jgi:tRNA U34 2-thiouridine synthase MnmA/TrmU